VEVVGTELGLRGMRVRSDAVSFFLSLCRDRSGRGQGEPPRSAWLPDCIQYRHDLMKSHPITESPSSQWHAASLGHGDGDVS